MEEISAASRQSTQPRALETQPSMQSTWCSALADLPIYGVQMMSTRLRRAWWL
jgi:hypothetical protein